MQKGNDRECQREGDGFDQCRRFDFGESEKRLKHLREERFAQPAKPKAGRCNSDLTCGKIGVQIILYLLCKRRPPAAFSCQRIDLAPADFHERKLGRDKEAVQQHEREDRGQFGDQQQGRVPMPRDRLSHRHCRRKE